MVGKHKCFFALQPNGTLNVGGEQKAYEELAQWEERIPRRDWSGAKASPCQTAGAESWFSVLLVCFSPASLVGLSRLTSFASTCGPYTMPGSAT
jgi:hypothetical protein